MAKEREVALWQEALKTGEQVHPLTEETLNKHMQGPIIIEDERNAQSVSHLPALVYNVFGNSLLHVASHLRQLLCSAKPLHRRVYISKGVVGESDHFLGRGECYDVGHTLPNRLFMPVCWEMQ